MADYAAMRERIDYEAVLGFLMEGIELWSRRDVGWILAGYRTLPGRHRETRVLRELEQRGLIRRVQRGRQAQFAVAPVARQRVADSEPSARWNQPWDGKWRVFSYDLPEQRRQDRKVLWQALRARKLGLLQRSVWVWPRDVAPILLEIVKATGIPECFCGFESGRLFLCSDAEIVNAAWDFEEIGRRHQIYLQHLVANVASLERAGELTQLARVTRVERQAYQEAFLFDPLLPGSLCPKNYQGFAVQAAHQKFRETLRQRIKKLAPFQPAIK